MSRPLVNYANGALAVNDYATVEDLRLWMDADPPSDALRLLQHAMRLVDSSLTTAMYSTDTNGNATDTGILAALRDATCAQVEWWIANGDELASLDFVGSSTIEGVTTSRIAGRPAKRLCDRAQDVLKAAKLVPGTVVIT